MCSWPDWIVSFYCEWSNPFVLHRERGATECVITASLRDHAPPFGSLAVAGPVWSMEAKTVLPIGCGIGSLGTDLNGKVSEIWNLLLIPRWISCVWTTIPILATNRMLPCESFRRYIGGDFSELPVSFLVCRPLGLWMAKITSKHWSLWSWYSSYNACWDRAYF